MRHRNYLAFLPLVALAFCGQAPVVIDFGKAECAHCRMNVVDKKFGAVLVTNKGRQYVFDGVECMVPFVGDGQVDAEDVTEWWVCDHAHPGELLDATRASFVHGDAYRSPMRGDVAAFATAQARDSSLAVAGGEPLDWEGVTQKLAP